MRRPTRPGQRRQPDLPTVPIGTFDLARRATLRVDHRAEPTGAIALRVARTDGGDVGDVAVTLVGAAVARRFARIDAPVARQTLLPGDYLLYLMGGHVQWVDGLPVHVTAGATTPIDLELPPARRCHVHLTGLPPTAPGAARLVTVTARRGSAMPMTFTLAADAQPRFAAVLPAGDYRVEHVAADGAVYRGEFGVDDATDAAAFTVSMAPR